MPLPGRAFPLMLQGLMLCPASQDPSRRNAGMSVLARKLCRRMFCKMSVASCPSSPPWTNYDFCALPCKNHITELTSTREVVRARWRASVVALRFLPFIQNRNQLLADFFWYAGAINLDDRSFAVDRIFPCHRRDIVVSPGLAVLLWW